MINAFSIIENSLGIHMDMLILMILTVAIIIFSARGIELGLIIGLIIYSLLSVWYYAIDWDYATPFKLAILCIIMMAITINTKSSGETII